METTALTVASELFRSTTDLQLEIKEKPSMTTMTTSSGVIAESANTPSLKQATTCTCMTCIAADQSVLANQRETITAWIPFAMMSILFSGSLTINVIVLAFLVYKRRQLGGGNGQHSGRYEIEGNPCYEATEMKQSSEREEHIYEIVREKRAK